MNKPQSLFCLTGKVAVVTGAAGLLGQEHVIALHDAGAKVYGFDVDFKNWTIDGSGLNIEKQKVDITDENAVREALLKITENDGRCDIVVNNASLNPKVEDNKISSGDRIENFDFSGWDEEFDVGLKGALIMAKHFGSFMVRQGGGVILNIASDLSVIAPDQRLYQKSELDESEQPVKPITYCIIKTGLVGLTRYLAAYWGHKNVRVNALSPGGVFSDQPEDFVSRLNAKIPIGRMANSSEYRGAITFLCSDASSYLTGQNIVLDGGRSII